MIVSRRPTTSLTAIPEKSIAVLPFVNMSKDKANEYFSDGISEELLNLLAKIESSNDLFKMLTEEKIGIFQDVTVIRHDKKIDLRVTPVEARMRA